MSDQEQAIRQAVQELVAAFNTHDPETFAAAFAPDAQFTDVAGNTARGRDAIAALHVFPFTRLFRNAVLGVQQASVLPLTAEVASVNLRWDMRGHTTPQGEPLSPREGLMHLVLVRREGRWWPVVAQNTDYSGVYAAPSP